MIDPNDLIDTAEVAELIGLSNRAGVSVYRRRYDDFPRPVLEKGRCVLWDRAAVERWANGQDRPSQAAIDRAKEDAELVEEVLYLEEKAPELMDELMKVEERLTADIDSVLGSRSESAGGRHPRRKN